MANQKKMTDAERELEMLKGRVVGIANMQDRWPRTAVAELKDLAVQIGLGQKAFAND